MNTLHMLQNNLGNTFVDLHWVLIFFTRYNTDLDTPVSSVLSPKSTCVLSPYSFGIDSPPPTAAEFTEYFNAPAMYMEKDFSQLTLSGEYWDYCHVINDYQFHFLMHFSDQNIFFFLH